MRGAAGQGADPGAPRDAPARFWRRRLPATLLVTLALALCRFLAPDPLGDAIERRALDLRFQVRGAWPAPAALVTLDEALLDSRGGPAALRASLARALPLILAQDPAAVAVDLLLDQTTPSDGLLAAAVAGDPRVVLAAAARSAAPPDGNAALDHDLAATLDRSAIAVVIGSERSAPPAGHGLIPPALAIARAARLGHVNLLRDPDRSARSAPLAIADAEGRMIPAISLVAAAIAGSGGDVDGGRIRLFLGDRVEFAGRRIGLDPANRVLIDHPGPPGALPAWELDAVLADRLPPGALAGRIVFIGGTDESLNDGFVTPFGPDASGVEILAGLAAGLAEGRVIRRDAATAAVSGLLALLAAAAMLAAAELRARPAALLCGVGAAMACAAAAQAFFSGASWALDAPTLLAGLAAGGLIGGEARYRRRVGETLRLRRERGNLARFVAPALADRLAEGGAAAFPQGRRRAGIVFVDLVGSTAMSEKASPEEAAALLAALHEMFESEASRHGGIVAAFQGDGALIVFGLDADLPDAADRALLCAAALVEGAAALEAVAPPGAGMPRLRAGVHFGDAAAAVLGGRGQAVVSIAGDAVNLASRLLEAARAHDVAMVTTRGTLDAAGPAAREGWRLLATEFIRGRQAPAELWTRPVEAEAARRIG